MFKSRSNLSKGKRKHASSESSDQDHDDVTLLENSTESLLKAARHGISGSLISSQKEKRHLVKHDTVRIPTGNILAGDDALRTLEDTDAAQERVRISRDFQPNVVPGDLEGDSRGMKSYRAHVEPGAKAGGVNSKSTLGPQRSTANVRSTSRFDYQMDVCKDYKESGYCGFGDSCKFLHDRSDYKSGWQLESEWTAQQRQLEKERFDKFQRISEKRKEKLEKLRQDAVRQGLDPSMVVLPTESDNEDDQEMSEKDKCSICGKKWSDCLSSPCVSICGHYFCESCFGSTSTSSCRVCNKPTQGIFNSVVH